MLTYDDFVEAAFSDLYIADLFSLDQMFQKHVARGSLPSANSLRKSGTLISVLYLLNHDNSDATAYRDPKKMLIKKKETRELAKLTHSMRSTITNCIILTKI